ncbi:MAG: redoxin family protein [Pseudomonadota bacterium]
MRSAIVDGDSAPVDLPLLEVGDNAPDFALLDSQFGERSLAASHGKRRVLITAPSVDVDGIAATTQAISDLLDAADIEFLVVSRDLPFTLRRFAAAVASTNCQALSAFRDDTFGRDYGVAITDGRHSGLLAESLFVIDENETLTHVQFADPSLDLNALGASLGLNRREDS